MKRFFPVIFLLACMPSVRAQAPAVVTELAEGFCTPPRSAGVYVWWHWMDSIGITGLHQFDAGGRATRQTVPEKVQYMSEEWKEDFRYAIALADSPLLPSGLLGPVRLVR